MPPASGLTSLAFLALQHSTLPQVPDQAAVNEPVTREISWSGASEHCDFSRITIRPGGEEFLFWLDRRPLFRAYAGYYPASTIAWMQRTGPAAVATLKGEVSALNWLEDGSAAEFLLNGREHTLLSPEDSRISSRPASPAWRLIGIKNLRWGGLSATMADRLLTDGMPQNLREIGRRRGFVLAAEQREYHPNASEAGPPPPSTLERFYPESAYAAAKQSPATAVSALPRRPVFDARTGRVAGWQDVRTAYDRSGNQLPQSHRVPGAFIRDVVALGERWAILSARPDGSHWVSVADAEESWSRQICGPLSGEFRGELVTIAARGIEYPAFLHKRGQPDHLVIRFHGGPYSSILDSYPSDAARRVGGTGHAILEVSSLGSRHEAGALTPRVDPRKLRAFSDALAEWVGQAGYSSVTVLGESFGAVGAIDYALADRERVRQLVLMVPLTIMDPERNLAGRPVTKGSFQWSAEAVIIGEEAGRRRFARWLEESVAEACNSLPMIVIVGAEDVTTPPQRQAKCAQEHMIVIPSANHATVHDADEAWRWLEQQ